MKFYYIVYLSLFQTNMLLVACRNITLHRREPPSVLCSSGDCSVGYGNMIPGEPLQGYLAPDATVINLEEYTGDVSQIGNGNPIVVHTENIPKLRFALLERLTSRQFGTRFSRWILDANDGRIIGMMFVERPIPDPDKRFEDLIQDPLLHAIPTGIRSLVDPASLVPSSTQGCATTNCLVVVPSVDLFFFGPDPTNTACLSTITSPPPSPTLPTVDMDPTFVYIVAQPIQVFDLCRNWIAGVDGPPITYRARSASLSTLEYRSDAPPATKSLDFADLPCPPSDVANLYESGAPYFPILTPLMRTTVDNTDNFGVCQGAAIRDPPTRAHRVKKITGPKGGGSIP